MYGAPSVSQHVRAVGGAGAVVIGAAAVIRADAAAGVGGAAAVVRAASAANVVLRRVSAVR